MRRLLVCSVVGLAVGGPAACFPLRDLDEASSEYGETGGTPGSGGESLLGGEGGGGPGTGGSCASACMPAAPPVCGDGEVNVEGEECDDGGVSGTCDENCRELACPAVCTCFSASGSRYAVCDGTSLDWPDARAYCQAEGLDLVSLNGSVENDLVRYWMAHTSLINNPSMWIGGTDQETEGSWSWVDGTRFWEGAGDGTAPDDAFEAWMADEPNNSAAGGEEENCARLIQYGGWYDDKCESAWPFVCEARVQPQKKCGNGALDPGEACDGVSPDCDADCTRAVCGDGIVNALADEACDDGNADGDDLDACAADCRTTGLVGYWPLLERTGDKASDLSATAALGDLKNVQFTNQAGLALGDNQWVEVPKKTALAFRGHFTLSAHVRMDAGSSGIQTFAFRGAPGTAKFFMRFNNEIFQGASIVTSADEEYVVGADLGATDIFSANTWHHYAYTFDGVAYRLYLDAEPVATLAATKAPVAGSTGWYLGSNATAGEFLHGRLGNVRFFERVLSDVELATLAERVPQ